jgi:hypothetical protein
MRDAPGKESFRKLVFRVNSNLKRRIPIAPERRRWCGQQEWVKQRWPPKEHGKHKQSEEEDIVQAIEPLWVTGKDGKFRVVALAHEIAACPGRLLDSRYSPSDLRLSEFINRLTKEHDFDPKQDRIELYREDEEAAMVDDQKAWERLILIRYMQGKPLKS